MRCIQDVSSSSEKCQRCERRNIDCVFTERSTKRRRKRTDTRVAELEKEVKAMSTALRQGHTFSAQRDADDDIEYLDVNEDDKQVGKRSEHFDNGSQDPDTAMTLPRGSSASVETGETTNLEDPPQFRVSESRSNASNNSPVPAKSTVNSETGDSMQSVQPFDVIDRGLLSMAEASRLYARYTFELVQYFPTVILPEGYDAVDIRRTKPTLFLAVIAAASGSSDAELNVSLNKEILQVYADQIVIQGEKSLELIQSMLITIAWYCPPDNFEELKFYQYIHMAATMALDLGIGRKTTGSLSNSQPSAVGSMESPGSDPSRGEKCRNKYMTHPQINSGLLESRRTLLSCYLNCSKSALSLHL